MHKVLISRVVCEPEETRFLAQKVMASGHISKNDPCVMCEKQSVSIGVCLVSDEMRKDWAQDLQTIIYPICADHMPTEEHPGKAEIIEKFLKENMVIPEKSDKKYEIIDPFSGTGESYLKF